jgi:hypothetical protein
MRVLLVAGGVVLLLGQVVPLWLGRSLLDQLDGDGDGDDDGDDDGNGSGS